MKFLFQTSVTMKEHNNKKWWIDSNIVKNMYIEAPSLADALKKFQQLVEECAGIVISNNALKTKNPMMIDVVSESGQLMEPKQIGYVITGQKEFYDNGYSKPSKQYIDLWVEIITIVDTEF